MIVHIKGSQKQMCNVKRPSLGTSWQLLKGLTCRAPAVFPECGDWTACLFLSDDHQFVVSKASSLPASPSLSG